jgi:hypothetical protein
MSLMRILQRSKVYISTICINFAILEAFVVTAVHRSPVSETVLKPIQQKRVSLCILAYNEASRLDRCFASLFTQSLFQRCVREQSSQLQIDLLVVANGCVDETAAIAQLSLTKHLGSPISSTSVTDASSQPSITWQVIELSQKGKSNAWNLAVHRFSNPETDCFIFMDADIHLLHPQTLENLLHGLQDHPEAQVTTDRPIKDVLLKQQRSWSEGLSAKMHQPTDVTELTAVEKTGLCGQLYCARATALRNIWLPPEVTVEDGFLRAMIVTDGFTCEENLERIQVVPNATHCFEAYTRPWDLIRHEKRQIIGTTINAMIFNQLWRTCSLDRPAGQWIEQQNVHDPNWVRDLLQQQRQTQGWWLIPLVFSQRRFKFLQKYDWPNRLRRFPIALLAFFIDHWVFLLANWEIQRTGGLGFWGR